MLSLKLHPLTAGLLLVTAVGSVSWYLGSLLPNIGNVTFAILLGIIVGNVLPQKKMIGRGGVFAEKKMLPLAIALLGVELHLLTLVTLGLPAAIIIGITMTTAITSSIYIGRFFGFSPKFSILMGAGNGICGSSAVAATSLVIDAQEVDTGISISIVNLLGTLGLVLMPAIIRILSLTDIEGGLLVGGTLQAFGQVVAAGFAVNDNVGQFATVVKMGRILMLGPMLILIGYWAKSQITKRDDTKTSHVRIPRFIIGFFIISLLASFNIIPPDGVSIIKTGGKFLLVLAMAGIGMRIQLRSLMQSGLKSLAFGMMIATIQLIVVLLTILIIV